MSARATSFFGAMFAFAGVACWVVACSAWGPPDVSRLGDPFPRVGGLDVRWACIGVAVAGLLLLARSDRVSVWLAFGATGAWLIADVTLGLSRVDSVAAVWLVGAALAGVIASLWLRPAARTTAMPRSLLVYSGVLVGLLPTTTYSFEPELIAFVRPLGSLVPVLLAAAAVVVALAARPTVSRVTGVVALVVGAAVAYAFFAVTAGASSLNGAPDSPARAEEVAALIKPATMMALVLLGGLVPRTVLRALGFLGLLPLGGLWSWVGLIPWTFAMVWDQPWEQYMQVGLAVFTGFASGLITTSLAKTVAERRRPAVAGALPGPPDAGRRRDWRFAIAAALTAAGVVGWAVLAAVLDPAIRDIVHGWRTAPPGPDGYTIWPGGVEGTQEFELRSRDARWGAIVLGIGGLLLARRCGVWWLRVAVAIVTWLAAEWFLDVTDLRGLPAAAVAAVTAAVVTWSLVSRLKARSATGSRAEPAPLLIVYSGVCLAVGGTLLWGAQPWMTDYYSVATIAVFVLLTVSLVVAGILLALALAPRVERGRLWLATAMLAYGAAGVLLLDARTLIFGDGLSRFGWLLVVPLVLATAPLAGLIRGTAARWVMAGASAALVAVIPVASLAGVLLGWYATYLALPLIGWSFDATESISSTWEGIGAGAVLGLLALLPWTARPAAVPPEPALPDAPVSPPLAPTPLPSGQPDILEWPEPARR